jgi:hypothetical protein
MQMLCEDIPPYRYYELIVHEALQQANSKDCRATIFMNKMLGYTEEDSEADILCIGEKKNISFAIVIECKNLNYPKQGKSIPYFGKGMTRKSLQISLKKKRIDAFSSCQVENVIVLGVFNDDALKLEKIDSGLYVVGSKFEFSKGAFEFPQDMSGLISAWDTLSDSMNVLGSSHIAISAINELPLHPWYRDEIGHLSERYRHEVVMEEYDPLRPFKNIWEEDYDGWPCPED